MTIYKTTKKKMKPISAIPAIDYSKTNFMQANIFNSGIEDY
jgi:hypothetical protein